MARNRQRGFTLIELLTVVAIIGILAAILLPALTAARENARKRRARVECGQLEMALRSYFTDNRGWGTEGLSSGSSGNSMVNILSGASGQRIPYMEFTQRNLDDNNAFVDPWDSPYQVKLSVNNLVQDRDGKDLPRICVVWSKGPNRVTDETDSDDDDDILSWK